jgi:hypothetical protein
VIIDLRSREAAIGSLAQEVGGTLIGETGLMVMTGAESVEWYQLHQTYGFQFFLCHSMCAVPAIIMS